MATSQTYADAGVNIGAAELFARMIKKRVTAAWPGAGEEIGGFAGAFSVPDRVKNGKAGTDGTGTKAILAALTERFDGIGQDAVAMAAVDAYVAGVMPAAVLDTIAVAKLDPEKHIAIIDSIIAACKLASCRLIGGETEELPDMFKSDWMFNLNVTCIGFPLPGHSHDPRLQRFQIQPGQPVYGWPSYGPASNGFSLLRKVFKLNQDGPVKIRERLDRDYFDLKETLADALLHPTPIWIPEIEVQKHRGVRFAAHAHITGGGLPGNIPRILPPNCKVILDRACWTRPPIFSLVQHLGNVETDEMDRTFNQGIMMVSIVAKNAEPLDSSSKAIYIGCVKKRIADQPQVQFTGQHPDE